MKKSVVLVFLSVFSVPFNILAQDRNHEYIPFVEEGKVWICGIINSEAELDAKDCVFTIKGDTLINDICYKKVLCKFEKYYGDSLQHYYCAVREEACRVYSVKLDATEEFQLYDFSSPHETIYLSYHNEDYVRCSGGILDGYPKSQWMFRITKVVNGVISRYSYGFWWEGVGYSKNPFIHILDLDKSSYISRISVISCMKDGKYIYKKEWTAQPSSVINNTKETTSRKSIFDLQGRRIQGEPKHGVYIRDGKKVMK